MIPALQSKIIALFKSKKPNVFLAFFAISFLCLILAKLANTYTQTIDFDIDKTEVPDEVVLLNNDEKLQITFKTQGFNLLKYYMSSKAVTLNFESDLIKHKDAYVWSKNKGYGAINSQFKSEDEIVALNPDTLKFYYDVLATKKIPVILESKISYLPGYNTSEKFKIIPDSVTIIGAKADVDKVSEIHTNLLKLQDVSASIVTSTALAYNDLISKLKFSDSKIKVSAKVEKFTEGNLEIPISISNLPENKTINFYPKTIKLTYTTPLSNFKNITVSDFEVVCDYNSVKESQTYLIPEIAKQPEAVNYVKMNTEKIEFIITK